MRSERIHALLVELLNQSQISCTFIAEILAVREIAAVALWVFLVSFAHCRLLNGLGSPGLKSTYLVLKQELRLQ